MANPKYQRLSDEIPLQDMAPGEGASGHADSRLLLLLFSRVMDEVDEFNHTKPNGIDDFNDDLDFQLAWWRYKHVPNVRGRFIFLVIAFAALAVWLLGVVVYGKNGNPPQMASFNGTSLEPFSPSYNNVTLTDFRRGMYYGLALTAKWLPKESYPKENTARGYYMTLSYRMEDDKVKISNQVINYDTQTPVLLFPEQFAYKNNFFYPELVWANPGKPVDESGVWHMLASDVVNQWRLLLIGLYWMWHRGSDEYVPLQPPDIDTSKELKKIHWAYFSPDGKKVVFSYDHNLFVWDSELKKTETVTTDGSPDLYHGRTDWVYEEEVTASDNLVWWSPDLKKLVFVTLDNKGVDDYEVDYYVKDPTVAMGKDLEFRQYPMLVSFKYPKPGRTNPKPKFRVYEAGKTTDLKMDHGLGSEYVVYLGSWVGNDHFMAKVTDRTLRILTKQVWKPALGGEFAEINRVNVTEAYGGWVEKQQAIALVPKKDGTGYVDKVVNATTGRMHLAYFDSAEDKHGRFITSLDKWHVTQKTDIWYNKDEHRVYALGTQNSSMDSTVFGAKVDAVNDLWYLTDPEKEGLHTLDMSPDGKLANIQYKGPELVPWQRLVELGYVRASLAKRDEKTEEKDDVATEKEHDAKQKADDTEKPEEHQEPAQAAKLPQKDPAPKDKAPEKLTKPYEVVTKMFPNVMRNEHIIGLKKNTNLPTRTYYQVQVNDDDENPVMVNVMQVLPPGFDPTKKYPLLVDVYGGPGAQKVDKSLAIMMKQTFSAMLDCIVLAIDPRGTGGQDWAFASWARDKIGYWEPRDVVLVVKNFIKANEFVDTERTAVWGWSYGGFTTLKTLEYDQGATFKYGLAVAPVTNWMFYDLIYTERYMKTPDENSNYDICQIQAPSHFKNVNRFMVMHGTADDNVHFQNSMWLLDKFDAAGVENYDVHFFPDSDHLIQYNGAQAIVYDKIVGWLGDAFKGRFDDGFA